MAVRIQIRRDTSANWTSNNPVLYPGEIGFETDTKKFKIGPAVTSPTVATAWNSISGYANVVPSDLSNTLNDYILAADLGVADGPAKLNVDGNLLIPEDSIIFEGATANDFETTLTVTDPTADRTITLPDVTGTVVTTGDTGSVTNTMLAGSIANEKLTNSAITINGTSTSLGGTRTLYTDDITEDGSPTNLWFTDERAQDAIGNSVGTGLSYNDTTGAVSVDTATIQARVADVSDTEIGYLNGVTSAIQTQIDAKLASATASSTYAPINNPTFTGTVTLPGNPSTANEAATKSYVDNISAGLNFHAAVHAATTADLSATYDNSAKTLSASGAFPQIDGHTINETERVLVKSQSNAVQNGIYTLTDDGDPSGTWVLTRASDADNSPAGEIAYGDFTFVQNGTSNGGQGFIMTTTGTITLGTSSINYTQFNTGQSVVAGNGLSEATPGTLSINTAITADLSTAQTFTNKTLTSPKINEDVVLTATATELNYVDGVTSAIQTQLNAKAPLASPTFTGTVSGITATMVGLGNVDNTSDANKPVSTATQNALDLKVDESLFDAKGDLLVGSADNTPAKLSVGTNGYLLTANSSATNGIEWAAAPVSLPSQTGNGGKYLTTDGSTASWGTLVVPITTGTATLTANTATTIDTTALSAFTSIEYMVSLKQGSKVRTSKVVFQTDGTSVDMTEFAITETGGSISGVVVSATTASTNAVLQVTVTDAASTNVDVKFSKVAL
jgi:hypothetical protein